MTQLTRPKALVRSEAADADGGAWLEFRRLEHTLTTRHLDEVVPLIARAENAAANDGHHVAGFVTYEAAPAFDAALRVPPGGDLPLVWLGLFKESVRHERLPDVAGLAPHRLQDWRASLESQHYTAAVATIHQAIARGDTYQANFTFRLQRDFRDDPWETFCRIWTAQPVAYAAYIDLGDHVICSASPELFFRLNGTRITCRPMKGTIRRGLSAASDRELALDLYDSKKNRAENLMIVDMVRNDLGRIAEPGSVAVSSLFNLEKYASVYQLTSEVHAEARCTITDIFTALFPSASITGAPKTSTMKLLSQLENSPRGIYTGAVGYISPRRQAQFNVAIRTLHIDRTRQRAEYGTGAGIVWDSRADEEYAECATKAAVLELEYPSYDLFETLLWESENGFFLLDRHLDRLAASADYFDIPFDRDGAASALGLAAEGLENPAQRFRLVLDRGGKLRVESRGRLEPLTRSWRLALAPDPVSSENLLLYHKTTHRELYERASAAARGYDDVLLWNRSQQLTESTIANLVIDIGGAHVTPPVEDGLLAGTYREELIARGDLSIRRLRVSDLARASRVWLINSVRKWIAVERVDDLGGGEPRVVWRNPNG